MAALLPQVGHVVVIDNASDSDSIDILRSLQAGYPEQITLIENDTNLWLAAALNQGVRFAHEHGYEFVIFASDSDHLSPNAVDALLEVLIDPSYGKVGTVNPRVILGDKNEEGKQGDRRAVDLDLPVTGGCVAATATLLDVGPQREDFLIDLIDYDFGIRLREQGYRALEVPWVSMAYELGITSERRFLWRRCYVQSYSPRRRYYYARNGIVLARETRDPAHVREYGRFLSVSAIKIVLYEENAVEKLLMIWRGLRDGLAGRLGPYEEVERKPRRHR